MHKARNIKKRKKMFWRRLYGVNKYYGACYVVSFCHTVWFCYAFWKLHTPLNQNWVVAIFSLASYGCHFKFAKHVILFVWSQGFQTYIVCHTCDVSLWSYGPKPVAAPRGVGGGHGVGNSPSPTTFLAPPVCPPSQIFPTSVSLCLYCIFID